MQHDIKKIRVGAVSYLNTKPLLYGISRHPVAAAIELTQDYPARVAQQLMDDEIDLGLIPVAAIPRLKEHYLYTDICIGASGPVASVCIFSEVPLEQVTRVLLDYQSRTSALLATILLKEYWKSDAVIIRAAGEDYRSEIRGTTAALVIGDRAFEQRLRSPYIYDLAEAWQLHTGLPFVFAGWVANKPLPDRFVAAFDEANRQGLALLDELLPQLHYPLYDLRSYYTKDIDYRLDVKKREALSLFLEKAAPYS